jgi:AmmeMemoRadiSam system protein A
MADVAVPYRPLDDPSRSWLLGRCREAIARHLAHQPPLGQPADVPPLCQQRLACFVTLHTLGAQLRGCVGALEAHEPLWRQAEQMAIAAATRDPRFAPMRTAELDDIVVEVAALSPRTTARPQDVVLGRHGLWIEQGVHRGVLLPQAAQTYGWGRETFLAEACARAGLDRQAWRSGKVSIEVFTADVFTESTRLQ